MAGKHRSKRPDDIELKRVSTFVEPALLADLMDTALARKRSLSEEIHHRLIQARAPRHQPAVTYEFYKSKRKELMALEPKPDDTRTDLEIAQQIAAVMELPTGERSEPDDYDDIEIDWIPGSEGDLWNSAT